MWLFMFVFYEMVGFAGFHEFAVYADAHSCLLHTHKHTHHAMYVQTPSNTNTPTVCRAYRSAGDMQSSSQATGSHAVAAANTADAAAENICCTSQRKCICCMDKQFGFG